MKSDDQLAFAQKPPTTAKTYRAVLFLIIVAAFFSITAFLCQMLYSGKKQEILASQQERLQVNAMGIVDSMALWASGLDNQARRVSDSELYRLFATEVAQIDHSKAALLNDPEAASLLNGEAAQMVEMVPLMRNVLLDFMNYNGLQDARVVNAQGQTLLSSLARPTPLLDGQRAAVNESIGKSRLAFGLMRGTQSGLVLDYATPLLPVQVSSNQERPVASLLLTIPVTGQLAQFMARGSGPGGEMMAWVLQRRGTQWENVQVQSAQPLPVAEAAAPDARGSLPFAPRASFGAEKKVYSLGVRVPQLNWTLIQEIPAERVDAQLNEAFRIIFGIGTLLSLGVVLLLMLLWWIMVGREQRNVAQRFEKLYNVIRQQKQLLDSINISLDVGLLLADMSGTVQLANRAFARIVGKEESQLPGQNLGSLLGGNVAGQLQDAICQVAESGHNQTLEITLPKEEGPSLLRVTLFPFVDVDSADATRGAVITLHDITEFRRQSEQRRKQQLQTIEALVGAIERVDPYLTGHSHMMRHLAGLMADHMRLGPKDKDTLNTAASLSQMGKIFVPRDLLAKTDKLTPEELAELSRVPEYAYSVLRNIDFGMPVPIAIRQINEKLDGTGTPNSLKGEEITLHARVLGVVNTFCAMVSPRSFRAGLSVDVALENLRKQSNAYDQRVVETLAYVLTTPEGAQALTLRQTREE